MSLGSSGVVKFTLVHPGGRWVHSGSLGSLRFTLGVVAFTQVRHSGSLWRSLGSSSAVEFTRVRPGGHWVHPGSLGSFGFSLGVIGFIRGR